MSTSLSIIIPSLKEGDSVEKMVDNIISTIRIPDYEIIVVDSGGTELSNIKKLTNVEVFETKRKGAGQARNFGANMSKNDILIFADAHVEFPVDWGKKILNASNHDGIITPVITAYGDNNARASGFEWSNLKMDVYWRPDMKKEIHEVPFACSCCMAIKKEIFEKIGKFDDGLILWGSEDSELSIRTWLLGYRVLCEPSFRVGHLFRPSHPYKIDWFDIMHNKIRFAFLHFSPKRLSRFLNANTEEFQFTEAFEKALEGDVIEKRDYLFANRKKSDDWFFEKFPMNEWTKK